MLQSSTYALVGVRVHRLYGVGDGLQEYDGRSPWLVAIEAIPRADRVAEGWYPSATLTARAADDGFGNLLATGRGFQ